MKEVIAVIILEGDEDNLLVDCMSECETDIFSKRKDEGCYSNLIGRYLMDCENKLRRFLRVSRDIFQSHNFSYSFSL
jgi:hypothetical protein